MQSISDWIPVYPKNIKLINVHILDSVTNRKYLVDQSFIQTLKKIDGKTKLKNICKSPQFTIFIEMNKSGLINFKVPVKHQILFWLKFILSPFGMPIDNTAPNHRYDPPKGSLLRIFAYLFGVVIKSTYPLLLLAIVPAILFFSFIKFPLGILIIAALILSTILSIVIHEFAHVFVLCRNDKTRSFFILTSGLSISVVKLKSEPSKEFLTAAAGPLSTAVISCLFIGLSLGFNNPLKILMILEGLIFALASISIMPFFSDGKIALAYVTGRSRC